MSDFYVTLPSSVWSSVHTNTSSRYITQLPEVLRVEKDRYVVAATELIYPYSYKNIDRDLNFYVHFKQTKDAPIRKPVHLILPAGQYRNAKQIIEALGTDKPSPPARKRRKRTADKSVATDPTFEDLEAQYQANLKASEAQAKHDDAEFEKLEKTHEKEAKLFDTLEDTFQKQAKKDGELFTKLENEYTKKVEKDEKLFDELEAAEAAKPNKEQLVAMDTDPQEITFEQLEEAYEKNQAKDVKATQLEISGIVEPSKQPEYDEQMFDKLEREWTVNQKFKSVNHDTIVQPNETVDGKEEEVVSTDPEQVTFDQLEKAYAMNKSKEVAATQGESFGIVQPEMSEDEKLFNELEHEWTVNQKFKSVNHGTLVEPKQVVVAVGEEGIVEPDITWEQLEAEHQKNLERQSALFQYLENIVQEDSDGVLMYLDVLQRIEASRDSDSKPFWNEIRKDLTKVRTKMFTLETVPATDLVRFTYAQERISVHFDDPTINFVEFDEACAYFLGFHNPIILNTHTRAHSSIDYFGNVSTFYLYCDAVDQTIIGDQKNSLLTVIPCKGKYGDMVHHSFTNPRYTPLMSGTIDSIKIELLSEFGEPIKFDWGTTLVVLHFKQIK